MKFKIDENLPIEIAQFFRENGYDAMSRSDAEPHCVTSKRVSRSKTVDCE